MSIQQDVEVYLNGQPRILEAMEEGLLNHSALVRRILEETGRKERDFDAILVAVRRFRDRMRKRPKERRDVARLLKGSTIETRNRQAVVILDKDAPLKLLTGLLARVEKERERVSMVQTAHAVTLILNERFLPLPAALAPYVRKETAGLAAITIHSPEDIEEVPGLVAHITRLLAAKGINIVEIASCYTDTAIVVEKRDVESAMRITGF